MTVGGQVCMDGADLPNNQDQNDDTKINDCNINIYFSFTKYISTSHLLTKIWK